MRPHHMMRATVADVQSHLFLRNASFPHQLEPLFPLRRPEVASHHGTIRSLSFEWHQDEAMGAPQLLRRPLRSKYSTPTESDPPKPIAIAGLPLETSSWMACVILDASNSGRYAMPPKPPPEKPPEPLPDRLPVIRIKLPPKDRPEPPAKRPPPPPVVDPPPAHIC